MPVDEEIQNMLYKALIAFLPQSISYDEFVKELKRIAGWEFGVGG